MKNLKKALSTVLVPAVSIFLALAVGCVIMAAMGKNPFEALKFLMTGAFGSAGSIGTTLAKATPLIFTAICACFAYKCGVVNLGGEGQFVMGSVAGFLAAHCLNLTGFGGTVLTLIVSALFGAFWAFIPAVLKITRGQNEMIITIMMNYLATLFMGVIYTNWFREGEVPQTAQVDETVKLPAVVTGMRFTWSFVIAVAVALACYYFLYWTSTGFKMRAVGYNRTASLFNGFKVNKLLILSFAISGAIAGLGGGAELLGTQYRLINGFGAGYGFTGISIALIGQLHPIATVIVAIFFAALQAGSMTMQAATGVPTSVSEIIQALVIVFSVAGMALTGLPEFESFKRRLFGKGKEANQ